MCQPHRRRKSKIHGVRVVLATIWRRGVVVSAATEPCCIIFHQVNARSGTHPSTNRQSFFYGSRGLVSDHDGFAAGVLNRNGIYTWTKNFLLNLRSVMRWAITAVLLFSVIAVLPGCVHIPLFWPFK
jgi:hypothetical protein